MKRRTFLQIIGLTAVPIPPLVGADLGTALVEEVSDTTVIRVTTSIKPFHFKIPVTYEYLPEGGLMCGSPQKIINFEVLEDMEVTKVEALTHPKLAEFYRSVGVDRGWVSMPIDPIKAEAGSTVTLMFGKIYQIC